VLVAGAVFLYSELFMPDIYQADIKITVRPARADWGLSNTVGALLRSLAGDITTHKFLAQVIDRGQFDTTTSDLLYTKKLFVKDEASDFTIMITARDPYPDVAVDMVNLIAQIFKEERDAWNDDQDKRDRIEVEIRDWARDAGLYSPKTKLNAAAGGVAGALIGAVIVFVLEWLQASTVRSPQDLERLDIPALGAIPVESRRRRR
jgi:capsular polysaccharide biosynthesis protein